MHRQALLRGLPRLLVAWTALSLVASYFGAQLLLQIGPAVQIVVEQLMPKFIVTMSPSPDPVAGQNVAMAFRAIERVAIGGAYAIAPWIKVDETISAGHALAPAIILMSALAAWPYRDTRKAVQALLIGAVASLALTVWTTAVHFAGLFEVRVQRVADFVRVERDPPFYLTQMLFFELGGQWFVALAVAFAIASLVTRAGTSRPA
jgi:hypothetical protein